MTKTKKQLQILTRKLFSYFFRQKAFSYIVTLVKYPVLKREVYWVTQQLLNRGYLLFAYEVIRGDIPKISETDLSERIVSMMKIKEQGLHIEKTTYLPIQQYRPLFVVHNSLPYDGAGYALRTHAIAKQLQKSGIAPDIVTRPGYPWDLQVHRNKPFVGKHVLDGIVYRRLDDKEKTFKKGADEHYICTYAKALESEIDAYGYTLLHAHSNYLNALAAIYAGSAKRIPVVYEMRGVWHITRTTLDTAFEHGGMYAYESQMEKAALYYADCVVVLSKAMEHLVKRWGVDETKIHLIPNAVDTARFVPIPKSEVLVQKYGLEDKCVIGFLGSLTGYEGLKELVESVNELVEEGYDDLVLMIVGDGREKESLEKLANVKHTIFTGRVPYDEVDAYYSLFDICPFPRNNYEVCRYVPPMKVLEAMAMEKAVIVSNVAPLQEMVRDRKEGLVCKADSVESVKQAIVTLYKDRVLRESLGSAAREWVVQNRSWEENRVRYKALYDSLCEGGRCE